MEKGKSLYTNIDGNKLLMVAQQLVATIYAVIFAFPHIPNKIMADVDEEAVFFVPETNRAFKLAVENLLQTSDVLAVSLSDDYSIADITLENMGNLQRLAIVFGLEIFQGRCPSSTLQLYERICDVFCVISEQKRLPTRRDLEQFLLMRDFLPNALNANIGRGASLRQRPEPREGQEEDEEDEETNWKSSTSLQGYCAHYTVMFLQPYFADQIELYLPGVRDQVCSLARV